MMCKKFLIPALCFVFFTLATGLTGHAQSAGPKTESPQPSYTVDGKITFIEVDGTVIIRPDKGARAGGDRVVYLKEYTQITRNGKTATREDLKVGDRVHVSVGPMRDALKFDASTP